MRVLVISDTHGYHENLDEVLSRERPYERVIHLGDIEGAQDYIESAAGCPVEAVRGNNDFFSDLPDEQIIELAGKRIFMTHGHYYYVSAGVEFLIREARGRDVDLVMFGHTHCPLVRQEGGLWVLNPGSLSYPRQDGHAPSYLIMEWEENGEPEIFLNFL
ncbi:MAG: metallophosphoesterase [Eubacterium sp.]|nr:metallophosphoesterase [Eubacterium sp.]